MLQSFQDLADIVTVIKTHRSVNVMMNPACGNVVVRDESKCAKCSGMISTFVTQISTKTTHLLHGEPQPTLRTDHRLLTCERQLHMCTSLDCAQTNTSSMLRIVKNTGLLITGYWTMRTKKKTMLQSKQSFLWRSS